MVERVFDLDAMLAPIEGESPTGVDLREVTSGTTSLYTLRDLRTAASTAERNMVLEEDDGSVPEQWGDILDLAPRVLATESKDLRVACLLIEAAVRYEGFAAVRDGFDLLIGLIEQYWDGLYPPIEDTVEDKIIDLVHLNGAGGDGTLIAPLRKVPLTDGMSGAFGHWRFEQASELRKLNDEEKIAARIEAGAITYQTFEQAVLETPAAFYTNLAQTLKDARESFDRLDRLLTETCGAEAPPTSNIRNTLEQVADTVTYIMRTWNKGSLDSGDATEAGDGAEDAVGAGGDGTAGAVVAGGGTTSGGVSVAAAGAIQTREQAFSQLLKIAEFFRKTEPHSVIPHTLDELVRRGRLPLSNLLAELIPDEDARQNFYIRAGIMPPEDASSSEYE
ncbi:type VI secretion system protein TssA [Roseospira marina]|uniref:Type VI secretion system protein TssA n=1 Tax=Roseospira marina TaxID=140057 RepID=A0A5M6I9A1_9PROT|nr:type VI secretion system protein TssA [Roseospira marina]KAA5604537.1 type VI secretion system protein TssA [Roseospira marina]MBB4315280.1 type VI secretion system protein ImpA [Roseospira marina]MBB5088279.1 type VI secretion system protein ImpA [Roseospira marina]